MKDSIHTTTSEVNEFATADFKEFPEEVLSKGGVPTASARRLQVGDYPFGADPFYRPSFETRTKVIITTADGKKSYWKLTASQLKMLEAVIDLGWDVTVQYEKPTDWQTF